MKARIYTRNGAIFKEIKCERIEHLSGAFRVVRSKPYSYSSDCSKVVRDEYFITNLPMVVNGAKNTWSEPDPQEKGCAVRLVNDAGEIIREWKSAKGISYLNDMVIFKVDKEWLYACGNVIIEGD